MQIKKPNISICWNVLKNVRPFFDCGRDNNSDHQRKRNYYSKKDQIYQILIIRTHTVYEYD